MGANQHRPNKKLGEYIKKIRKRKKLSARDIAQMMGMNTAYINTLEHGEVEKPRKKTLSKLAEALSSKSIPSAEIYAELMRLAGNDTNIIYSSEPMSKNEDLERRLLAMPWKPAIKWATELIAHLEKQNLAIDRKMHFIKSRNLTERYNLKDFKTHKALNQILINHLRYIKQLQENRR